MVNSMAVEEATPFVLICAVCGNPALRLTRRPRAEDRVCSADFRHLDGSRVGAGTKQTCDSCQRPLRRRPDWDSLRTENIREVADG